ncbi:AAA family ATPase [Arthrobacter sp. H20]|uniref:AAA family ATPase n=1 Tax=Arthrobacter sp. H20 TaxID=1267981 RepID=UPI00047C2C43|nr:AAA family ATPase [Arthrobacter sp. H20]
MSRFVLITPDTDFEQRLRTAVSGGLEGEVRAFITATLPTDPHQLFASLSSHPEVLILGPEISIEEALRLSTIFDVQFPEISIILVSDIEPELVVNAMRAGIRDVLNPAADPLQIRVVLERACQAFATRRRTYRAAPEEPQDKGLVIGVFSPKGGVGKTTVATNIAVGLGKLAPMGVVLVDLDLQFGDVASGLYLTPEHTITDAVSTSASRDPLVLKAFLTVHPAGIYALCAPKNPAEADDISPDQVAHLLDQLAETFQYVVVDTAPGLPELGLTALERCTDVVWVAGMDIPSVRGLRSGLDILKQLNILPATRHVVLNMADSKTGLSIQDVEATIGAPVDVSIPRSRAVAYSTNRGIPLLQNARSDRAMKSMKRLVERFDPVWRTKVQRKLHRRIDV